MMDGLTIASPADGQVSSNDARSTVSSPPRRRLWRRLPTSLWLCVLLPTLVAGIYFGLLAADQYVAVAHFSVRGEESTQSDLLGSLTGLPVVASRDNMIVEDFFASHSAIEAVGRDLVVGLFAREEADWFARLDPADSMEDLVEYWRGMVSTGHDAGSDIARLEIKAFRPDDALLLATRLLQTGERLVNEISERTRRDAVAFAESELAKAEARLSGVRADATRFRNEKEMLSPDRSAQAKGEIIAKLEGELASSEAELASLKSYMRPTAAPVVSLEQRINAYREQILAERRRLASSIVDGEVMSDVLAAYEKIVAEQEFAELAYRAAQTAVEKARIEALRQHRYLVTSVPPRLAEEALYPRRLRSIVTVFACALVAWGVGVLAIAAVKDHAGWV